MTAGDPAGALEDVPAAPPGDTGEALGLGPARLTVTFGLGPSLFARDELGLASRRPTALQPIGKLPGDSLSPERSDGDLCVQACANDPQVAFHAVRNLARIGRGAVVLRWTQFGFGRTTSTTSAQETARNLQGFKDGTNNLHGDDPKAMKRFVWVGDEEPQRWFRDGTYLVARRIRMLIEIVGPRFARRTGSDHRPSQGERRAARPALESTTRSISTCAAPAACRSFRRTRTSGSRRRPRTAAADPAPRLLVHGRHRPGHRRGRRRPVLHLLPARPEEAVRRDSAPARITDPLNEYIVHTGGGLFAVPPGARPGGFVGEGLFS